MAFGSDWPVWTGPTFRPDKPPDAVQRVLDDISYLGRPVTARVLIDADADADDARRRYGRFAAV